MTQRCFALMVIAAITLLMQGCGTMNAVGEWWRGPSEAPRVPPGSIEYLCDGDKRFLARFEANASVAWVRFPEREFRLDAVVGGAAGRYTNG